MRNIGLNQKDQLPYDLTYLTMGGYVDGKSVTRMET